MGKKLLPCPFCGGEANLVRREFKTGFYPSGGTYYVHCKSCLITTQPRNKLETVIDAWNRRAERTGRWIPIINTWTQDYSEYGKRQYKCSECGRNYEDKAPYCRCGAHMKGDEDDG